MLPHMLEIRLVFDEVKFFRLSKAFVLVSTTHMLIVTDDESRLTWAHLFNEVLTVGSQPSLCKLNSHSSAWRGHPQPPFPLDTASPMARLRSHGLRAGHSSPLCQELSCSTPPQCCVNIRCSFFFLAVIGVEHRTPCVWGKCPSTALQPQLQNCFNFLVKATKCSIFPSHITYYLFLDYCVLRKWLFMDTSRILFKK